MPDRARSILLGALLQGACSLYASLRPPFPGEALSLRWLRALAEHPLRGWLALALICFAAHSSAFRKADRDLALLEAKHEQSRPSLQ